MGNKPGSDEDSAVALANEIRQCELCKAELPCGPRPVVQLHSKARILVAGQAPGSKVHSSGVPFDDASGDRLRDWLGLNKSQFYNPELVAIVPMGFCYPGKGKSGDLPPLTRCAETWRKRALDELPNIEITLIIGQYALAWHLPDSPHKTLTETVKNWRELPEGTIPLPHPSPRNNIWLKKNSWFEEDVVPELRRRVTGLIPV